jgi:SAM-dependent methyltransferase
MGKLAQKLIKKTQEDYNILAEHFSYSRGYIWPDMKVFEKEVFPGAKVLDVGCGHGRLFEMLRDNRIDYLGLDFSESLLVEAKKRYPQAEFRVADITQENTWQKLKNKFDFVFCVALFHHLPTLKIRKKVIDYFCQALRPEGKVFITVWNLWNKKNFKHHFSSPSIKLKWQLKDIKAIYVPYSLSRGGGETRTIYRFLHAFTLGELKNLFQDRFLVEKCWSSGKNLCLVSKKKI